MSDRQSSRQLTEDEWIVLLDLYQTHRSERLSAKHPTLLNASETLRALGRRNARNEDAGFRPPSGLHHQLSVFRRLDTSPQPSDRKTPHLAENIWRRFSSDPSACRVAADAVRAKVDQR